MVAQTISYSKIADKQIGLCIALAVTTAIAGAILQITKRVTQIPAYFNSNYQCFTGKSSKLLKAAAALYYILLLVPVVLLILWVVIIGVNVGPNPALPILFIGISVFLILIPSQSKLFYLKTMGIFISYVTAELLILGLNFDASNNNSFWTLTAISLTLNSIFVILCMWFMDDRIWSIPQDTPSSIKRQICQQVKIWKQQQNPPEIIDGGLYAKIANMRFQIRVAIIVLVYFFSLLILLAYSLIGKYCTSLNFQAFVNSGAIITTDIVTFMLMIISKKHGFDPNLNAVIVVSMRVCIIAFSGHFWFIGYCLLYLILMLYISILVINKYYPKYQKPLVAQIVKNNIFKMPEAAALILLVMFSGLVYYMAQDQGKTLPIIEAKLGQNLYPFWSIGVSAILLSLSVFFYLICKRIIHRGQMKIRSATVYFLGCEFCGQYYFFILASYSFLLIIGFHLYSVVQKSIIWASCVFLPLFYESLIVFYTNWKQNDYLLLGDVYAFNKKMRKRLIRQQRIIELRKSVVAKMKDEQQMDEQTLVNQQVNMKIMDNAYIQQNWILENYDVNRNYEEWRGQSNVIQAFQANKLLPTDKKVVLSIPVMILTLLAYSLTFFFTEGRDMTAFTVTAEILVLFLVFIPIIRYFQTFQDIKISQLISLILGIAINYGFGVLSYVLEWNRSPAYSILWTFANPFLVVTYASMNLIQDKGLTRMTIVMCVISMLLSFGPGILLLVWFNLIEVGIVFIGIGFYYTYFVSIYLIYTRMNNSVHFSIYPITICLIVATCFAVMVYSFLSDTFDDFYGFSITYLVVNLLLLIYAIYRVVSDILTRADKPNFYSPYGLPIYKYDQNIKSVVQNNFPMQIWFFSWLMFYIYTKLMQIFMVDSNYGTSASMIPLIFFSLTFFYFVTYNLNLAGKIKESITEQIQQSSWKEVLQHRDRNLGNLLNLDDLQKQLENILRQKQNGTQLINLQKIRIKPKDNTTNVQSNLNQTSTQVLAKNSKQPNQIQIFKQVCDIQAKILKATQNDKILLVNFWTMIIFKTQSRRKRKMMQFISFIKDSGDILAGAGITLIVNDALYDLQLIYNQAFQQFHSLSSLQRVYFNKNFKLYLERKQRQEKQRQQINKRQQEDVIKRQKQFEKKIMKDNNNKITDPSLPIQKMKDGPQKLKKLKQSLKTIFTDPEFKPVNDYIPQQFRSSVKGWKRPSKDSHIFKNNQNSSMSVRQGMIGNCYLISAIGVLGKQRLKSIITDSEQCPEGAYMVKFNKFNKNLYVIIDNQFPVGQLGSDNQWLFGRCQNQKQLFCNIIQKAYAKIYGGYQNIIGGKVALALSQMTGGFPEQIQLKPYQQTNTNQIFDKMLEFKKAGYLMGAGSPPNAKGDAVQIDGIYQGHAYLILDVRNLDGNKLIKLRNPHGNQSKQSTLDWSDNSPKWTNRLKGLLGQNMSSDGAFWMGLEDFVYCYRALYICRIFDQNWIRVGPYSGVWKGKSAAGLKNNSGPVILSNNPHYGIKVTKSCTLFVKLTQNEIQQGGVLKNKIFFMIQRNAGKRIDTPSTNKLVGMSGPAINSKTITKQINLTADSFPYTFSLLLAIYDTGAEGSYTLEMYCNDKSIEIIEDNLFGV